MGPSTPIGTRSVASDDRVGDVVDRLRGRDLLHEKRPDPEPRVTRRPGFVSGFVEPVNLIALDEYVFPLMICKPTGEVRLIEGLLSIRTRSSPPGSDESRLSRPSRALPSKSALGVRRGLKIDYNRTFEMT